tara:strand:+ start:112 stop:342 length:231 start_codon:yes stop_codon:yes gene_type:complete
MQTFDKLGTLNAAQAPVPMSQFSTNELREWAKITEKNLKWAEQVLNDAAPGDKWAMATWTEALNEHHAIIKQLGIN